MSPNDRNSENPLQTQGILMVEVRGFEPLTSSVRGKRSAGLSYTPNWGTHVTPPGSRAKLATSRGDAEDQPAIAPEQPSWSDRLCFVR